MASSRLNTRAKTIVAVLIVAVVLVLVGIGILAARLLADGRDRGAPDISVDVQASRGKVN
jgi:cell division protein FtsX